MTSLYIGSKQLETITELMPHHKQGLSYTATGYGSKIPTQHKVKYNGRFYRVYCAIFSNSGTLYIIIKGVKIIVRDYPL
jgi:hypothetical protein